MFKASFLTLRPVFLKLKATILGVLLLGVLAGVIPTLKSSVEGAVLDTISNAIRNPSSDNALSRVSTDTVNVNKNDAAQSVVGVFGIRLPEQQGEGTLATLVNLAIGHKTLLWATVLYFILVLFTYGINILNTLAAARLRNEVFAKLYGTGLRKALVADFERLRSWLNVAGHYSIAIHRGAENVSDTYRYLLSGSQEVFALFTIVSLLATKNIPLAICVFLLVIVQVGISVVQARRLEERRVTLDDRRNNLVDRCDDILQRRELLLAYEQQDKYGQILENQAKDYGNVQTVLDVLAANYSGLSNMITDWGRLIVLIAALVLTLSFMHERISSIGDAYFIVSIYVRTFVPVMNLLSQYNAVKESAGISKTFLELLTGEEELGSIGSGGEGVQTRKVKSTSRIEFDNVEFQYPRATSKILTGCTFEVPAKCTTLVVGASGGGKATIARLILGYFKPSAGTVKVDGIATHLWRGRDLREQMSYVAQGDYIVEGSIEENLRWAYKSADKLPAALESALSAVGLHNIQLSGSAQSLSFGEKQRLSIARMILDESDIAIMDEPLAGADVLTSAEVIARLGQVFNKSRKTVVIFSHKLEFASLASHVVVLKEGVVVEQGSPKVLASNGGEFARLHAAAVGALNLPQ